MDFSLFASADTATKNNSLIGGDTEKNKQILTKLFEKRKLILFNPDSPTYQEDLELSNGDLATFGASKIDYEIYLASHMGIAN